MNLTPKNRKKHPVSAHVCRQGQRYEPCWHVSRGFFKSLKKTCWLTFCSHLCSVSLWFSQHGYCFCLTAVHFTSRGLIAFHLSVSVLIHGSQRLVVAILKEILMSWKLLSTLSVPSRCFTLWCQHSRTLSAPTSTGALMGRSFSILRRSGLRVSLQFSVKVCWSPSVHPLS